MIRIAIVEDDQSADDQLTACLEKLSLQSKEVFDLSHYPDAQQFLFAFHSQFDLRIPLIIAPKPSTSSPLTKISRKSAVQAHCLHTK